MEDKDAIILGTVILTITAGLMTGKKLILNNHDVMLCGRQNDCDLPLPHDSFISGRHFLLEVHLPNVLLRDLGSRHGTYVNGKRYGGREKQETPEDAAKRHYPQVKLHDGDEIIAGTTTFQVRLEVR